MTDSSQVDKAGHAYWDQTWAELDTPTAFDPYNKSLDNTFYRRIHKYFDSIIEKRKNLKILEIGCAHSIWPLYFTRYYDAYVDGVDYSETGCTKTRAMWDAHGLNGKIVCANMFDPPDDMKGQYDLVMSFGVVEHFKDTTACLKACAAFVKPGGQMFTMIPNMTGLVGSLQKIIDRNVYDIHVPLSCKMLMAAHVNAGLNIEEARYFMGLHLGVVNSGRYAGQPVDKFLRRALSVPGKLLWTVEKSGIHLPANKVTSPYIFTLARV